MSKKTVVAAAVALVVVAYAGGTWYSGDQSQKAFAEAVAELKHALGKEAVVTDSYEKGFFSSQARLAVEWTPKAPVAQSEEHDGDEAEPASAAEPAAPAKPMRVVVNSDIRHGPIAGGKIAAAVVESRFSVEGVDDKTKQAFAKASMPTLTGVRHLMGSSDWRFALPAGEFADAGVTARWAEMAYNVSVGSDNKTVSGDFKWPELVIAGLTSPETDDEELDLELDEEDEGDDGTATAEGAAIELDKPARPREQMAITVKGMDGTFQMVMIEGLWGAGPGKTTMKAESAQVTNQKPGGQPEVVAELKNLSSNTTMEADAKTLSVNSKMQGVGQIGPLSFESIGYEQDVKRIDIESIRSLQQMLVERYRVAGLAGAMEPPHEQMAEWALASAPKLVQALPSYQINLKANYKGNAGELGYGIAVLKAPTAEEMAGPAMAAALLKGSALNANARLPKAWLGEFAKASGKDVDPEQVEAMVEMATGSGYVRAEGDFLTTTIKVQDGKMDVNGEVKPLPMGLGM